MTLTITTDPHHAIEDGTRTVAKRRDHEVMAIAPLSPRQQGLWIHDNLESTRAVYNITLAFELRGQVDPDALSRALAIVVDRHESLRTNFVTVQGETFQQVLPATGRFALPTVDLTRGNPEDTTEELTKILYDERRTPFDLSDTSPLIRARLLTLGPQHHVLVTSVHHIVSDGWSHRVMLGELGAIYADLVGGRKVQMKPAPTFLDYIRWQQDWSAGDEAEDQAAYWADQLADAPPLLPLPTDRPRRVERDYDGARMPFALDEQLTTALKAFAREHQVSLYSALLTAWSVLLSRLSGLDDVVIGVPTANRGRSQSEDVCGYFVNTVAVRVKLFDTLDAAALCRRTYASLREALAHGELPFERVVERLNPPRSLSHSPIFQTTVVKYPKHGMLELAGAEVTPLEIPESFAMFDLTLGIADGGDPITGYIEYATSLFDDASIQRYGNYLVRVLEQFVAEPDRRVIDIDLLNPDDQANLIDHEDGFGDGLAEHDHTGIVERFAAQVAQRPDQPAVIAGDEQLSYLELDRRANGVAHALIDRGVGPGQVVALYADRSVHLLVGILGVLKSGAAFLPVDRAQPAERWLAMIGEAAPAVILSCVDTWPPGWNALRLSDIGPDCASPPVEVRPNDPAYVLYTSGSTGRPKGVAVSNRSISFVLDDWLQRAGTFPGQATSAWYSAGFDVAVLELLTPLCTGAVVNIVPEDVRTDPTALVRWMRDHRIVQAYLSPSHMAWIAEDPHARLSGLSLRQVMTGLEPQSELTLYRVQEALPGLQIHFTYGPTEATVYATAYTEFNPADRRCPIGRRLPGTRTYVLDRRLRPVPAGVVGEIYLAGPNVALGYLHRPELTAERFLPDPFVTGGRMYRTGDLARCRPDGTVEFVGRNDDQIKLRGFRIELGEVEAALRTAAGTSEAVVLVDHGPSGDKRLVAAVGCGNTAAATDRTWRKAMSNLLPDYMIPDVLVQLPRLPLNRNGKLDRDAILGRARAERQTAVNTATPRDDVEMALYRLWSEVLQHPRIGVSDDFFEIGGTSVLAVKLASAIERQFGRELPIRELMLRPTIERLAVALRSESRFGDAQPVIEFRAGQGRERVVCVHPAGGTAFCYLPLSSLLPEDAGVVGVQSPGVISGGAMAGTVEQMAAAYLDEIGVMPDESVVICGLSYGGVVAYEMARQLAEAGHPRISAVLLDARIGESAAEREALKPVAMVEFREKLVRFNGAYPEIGDDVLERYFQVYNHHRMTLTTYLPQTSSARMVYVQAVDSTAEIAAAWQRRAAGQLRLDQVDAGHWDMLEGSALGRVAEIISEELAGLAELAATQEGS